MRLLHTDINSGDVIYIANKASASVSKFKVHGEVYNHKAGYQAVNMEYLDDDPLLQRVVLRETAIGEEGLTANPPPYCIQEVFSTYEEAEARHKEMRSKPA